MSIEKYGHTNQNRYVYYNADFHTKFINKNVRNLFDVFDMNF